MVNQPPWRSSFRFPFQLLIQFGLKHGAAAAAVGLEAFCSTSCTHIWPGELESHASVAAGEAGGGRGRYLWRNGLLGHTTSQQQAEHTQTNIRHCHSGPSCDITKGWSLELTVKVKWRVIFLHFGEFNLEVNYYLQTFQGSKSHGTRQDVIGVEPVSLMNVTSRSSFTNSYNFTCFPEAHLLFYILWPCAEAHGKSTVKMPLRWKLHVVP